jgi:hypothetical protein
MITKSQRNTILFLIPVALLSVPLVAMQFTKEVNWSFSDFAIGGFILFGTAFIIKLILRSSKQPKAD